MPRKELTKAAEHNNLQRSDWDRRLGEARAKREKVLSARALAASANGAARVPSEPDVDDDVPAKEPERSPRSAVRETEEQAMLFRHQEPEAAETPATDLPRVRLNIRGPDAVKALFVFSGAAGLGVGVVLGAGVLIGLNLSQEAAAPPDVQASVLEPAEAEDVVKTAVSEPAAPVRGDTQMTDAQLISLVADLPQTLSLETGSEIFPDMAKALQIDDMLAVAPVRPQTVAAVAPVMVGEFAPPLPLMLDKDLTFAFEGDAAGELPRITNVKYMRDDLAGSEAVVLRTIPQAQPEDDRPAGLADEKRAPVFFMHAPDGLTDVQLNAAVSKLREAGVSFADIGRESFRVSTTHLRYYSSDTAEAAKAVARDLGVEARDFSQNERNSARVEVWIAGRPKASLEEEETSRGFFSWLRQGRNEDR